MNRRRVFCSTLVMLSACSSEPPFDYDGATTAERETFLHGMAHKMNKGFLRGFRDSGSLTAVYILDPAIKVAERKIVLSARLKQENARLTGDVYKMKQGLLEDLCPGYMKSRLAKAKIKVAVNLLYANGSTALGIEQNPSSCSKFVSG